MEKNIAVLFLALASLATTQMVIADPSSERYTFICPSIVGVAPRILTHFGDHIAGYGVEYVNFNAKTPDPYFTGTVVTGSNIPYSLSSGSYSNSNTSYASATGTVSCNYTSTIGFDPFTVSYALTNGKGGIIAAASANTIDIDLPIGFKKS